MPHSDNLNDSGIYHFPRVKNYANFFELAHQP
jgi:hypothetical protein